MIFCVFSWVMIGGFCNLIFADVCYVYCYPWCLTTIDVSIMSMVLSLLRSAFGFQRGGQMVERVYISMLE
jgi:hypothetical protein